MCLPLVRLLDMSKPQEMDSTSTSDSMMRACLFLRVCENVTSTTSVYSHTSNAFSRTAKSLRSSSVRRIGMCLHRSAKSAADSARGVAALCCCVLAP